MSAKPFLFRYSLSDAIVALCGLLNVAFLLWTFLAFPSLPWWALGLSFVVLAWAYCWNLQCISHNFIHNPFFTNVWLNRAFGVLETLCIGMPHQLVSPLPPQPPRRRQRRQGTRRHDARLVVDLSPRQRRRPGIVLALHPAELLPRRNHACHPRVHPAWPCPRPANPRRDRRARRVLAGHARCQLAIFLVFLSSVFLFGLGAQLRRGIPGALRCATGQSVRQLGQFVLLALQLSVVQQRLSSGASLGSEDALDAHEGVVSAHSAAHGSEPDAHPAWPAYDRIDRGLLQRFTRRIFGPVTLQGTTRGLRLATTPSGPKAGHFCRISLLRRVMRSRYRLPSCSIQISRWP